MSTKASVIKIQGFPKQENIYEHDAFNMGQTIGMRGGHRVEMMFSNHASENFPGWFIVAFEDTGERFKVYFDNGGM